MNKITREIATFIDNQNKDGDMNYQVSGLNKDQIDIIKNYLKAFNRSGFIPFPLKAK